MPGYIHNGEYEIVVMATIIRHFEFLMKFKISYVCQISIVTFPVNKPFEKIGLKMVGWLP